MDLLNKDVKKTDAPLMYWVPTEREARLSQPNVFTAYGLWCPRCMAAEPKHCCCELEWEVVAQWLECFEDEGEIDDHEIVINSQPEPVGVVAALLERFWRLAVWV